MDKNMLQGLESTWRRPEAYGSRDRAAPSARQVLNLSIYDLLFCVFFAISFILFFLACPLDFVADEFVGLIII